VIRIHCAQCRHYAGPSSPLSGIDGGCKNIDLRASFSQTMDAQQLAQFMRPAPSDTCSLAEAKK